MVGVYFDDLPIVGHPGLDSALKTALSDRFHMTDLGPLQTCVGIQIRTAQGGSKFLEQESYIEHILRTCKMENSKKQVTPAHPGVKLSKKMCPATEEEQAFVRKLVTNH
jgi:hypothetical protein